MMKSSYDDALRATGRGGREGQRILTNSNGNKTENSLIKLKMMKMMVTERAIASHE